jgi:hypothetical protein
VVPEEVADFASAVADLARGRSASCYVFGGIWVTAGLVMVIAPETIPEAYPLWVGVSEAAATSCSEK